MTHAEDSRSDRGIKHVGSSFSLVLGSNLCWRTNYSLFSSELLNECRLVSWNTIWSLLLLNFPVHYTSSSHRILVYTASSYSVKIPRQLMQRSDHDFLSPHSKSSLKQVMTASSLIWFWTRKHCHPTSSLISHNDNCGFYKQTLTCEIISVSAWTEFVGNL